MRAGRVCDAFNVTLDLRIKLNLLELNDSFGSSEYF